MRKTRNSLGFTMAELLIVVAIIAVLGGVVFIAVQNHQRSMAQLERNAVAKELFIATQNHLTMAESQGYPVADPDSDFFGEPAGDTAESDMPDGETDTPAEGTDTSDDENTEADAGNKITNVYYVIGPSSGNILDQILPFGSIDETVRAGGSYLIRYQTNPARVLDVFYVTTSGSPAKFNKDGGIEDDEYSDLMKKRDSLPSVGYVLGYYGGEEALASGDIILAPTVEVHNEERLTVTVTDRNNNNSNAALNNANAALKLIVRGEDSGAKMAITLVGTSKTVPAVIGSNTRFYGTDAVYTIVLDDITNAYAKSDHDGLIMDGLHFADLNNFANSTAKEKIFQFMKNADGKTPTFYPGEDITVQAVSYSNTALTNIAYSSARTTNSLFADSQLMSEDSSDKKAIIENFRHLENLDASISRLDNSLNYTGAEQIADMIWKNVTDETVGFVATIKKDKGTVKIYKSADLTGGIEDCYLPVIPSKWVKGKPANTVTGDPGTDDKSQAITLAYEGNRHSITGVSINETGDAGLFGSMIAGSSVANLKLVDFLVIGNDITEENTDDPDNKTTNVTAVDVGALSGKLTSSTVTNVVAYNSKEYEAELAKTDATKTTIKSETGNSGGLVGSMDGGIIQKSAAALIVNSASGNAGGLVGKVASSTVAECYSGGHAIDDPVGTGAVKYDSLNYNVTASAAYAGGLIGDAGAATINNSYSTCSVAGKYAGGFVGKGDTGSSATNSYATGLVLGGDTTTKSVTGDDGTSKTEITFKEIEAQEGAFAYAFGGTTTNCKFFEIVNEREEKDGTGAPTGGYKDLPPIPNNATKVIDALDENAVAYNNFCGASTDWKSAVPYKQQTKLEIYYGGKYNLKTVEQLAGTLKVDDEDTTEYFVATHYGDWPAPEIFVVNTK